MIDERTGKQLNNIEVLDDPQLYIYILLNSAGKVKVGKTTNIYQRVQSLSGSNSAGDKIIKCYCSPATYLYTLERQMHNIMHQYRIEGTEWFYYDKEPDGQLLYDSAVGYLNRLMTEKGYDTCNNLRKMMSERKNKK